MSAPEAKTTSRPVGRSVCSRWGAVGLLLACLLVVTSSQADVDAAARSAARGLAYAGLEAYDRGDYESAADKFEKAFDILKAPSIGLWSARAFVKHGQFVRASERYRLIGRLPTVSGEVAVQEQAQADAARELAELLPRIPMIIVAAQEPRPSRFAIDGSPVPIHLLGEPIPADPGKHRINAVRGDEVAAVDVVLSEAERKQVVLSFAEAPTSAARPDKPDSPWTARLGYTAIGLGGAALLTGAISGLVALQKKDSFDTNPLCHDNGCPRSLQDDVDSYNRLRAISAIGFGFGALLGAGGGVLLLTSRSSAASVGLRATPGTMVLTGRF